MAFSEVIKWLKLKPRQVFVEALTTVGVLFLPGQLLTHLGIAGLVEQFRPWIGLVCLVAIAQLALASTAVIRIVREFTANRRSLRKRIRALQDLTPQEQEVLTEYVRNNTKSRFLPADGVIGGLQVKGILYQSSPFGRAGLAFVAPNFSYNIADWAWNHLKRHPELLNYSEVLE